MNSRAAAAPVAWKDFFLVGLMVYLPLRLGISALVAVLRWLVPTLALPPRTELMARWDIPLPTGRLAELLLTPWLRFDALWFLKTALDGYDLAEPSIHHLPLYPLLTRLLHEIIGGHVALSALIISNVALILALGYVYRLVWLDDEKSIARRSTIYLAIFPTAFFYLIGYAESLFLLGSVSAFYYARQRAWFRAGLLGGISALARPQGVLILLPLALEFWQQEGACWRRQWFKALPLFLIPLGVTLYALYVHVTLGLPVALDADMAYWRMQGGVGIPGRALWLSAGAILQGIHPFHNSIDLVFALFGLAMTVWAVRTLRPSYWLLMALNVLVVISRPIAEYPLLSTPRFILPLFPMYILLGRAGEASPMINRLIVYLSLALLMFFSAQFALGGWVA
jgi:hypothetical protein